MGVADRDRRGPTPFRYSLSLEEASCSRAPDFESWKRRNAPKYYPIHFGCRFAPPDAVCAYGRDGAQRNRKRTTCCKFPREHRSQRGASFSKSARYQWRAGDSSSVKFFRGHYYPAGDVIFCRSIRRRQRANSSKSTNGGFRSKGGATYPKSIPASYCRGGRATFCNPICYRCCR